MRSFFFQELFRLAASPVEHCPDASRRTIVAIVVLTAFVVAPALLVDVPAIADYPNHLARMHLISLAGTSHENPYYSIDWAFRTNLGMDLIVPELARAIGVEAASKAFLILSELLIVTGGVALEIAVQKRLYIAGFVAASTLYSVPFAVGLLNFEFGMGLTLWGLACWIATENQSGFLRWILHSTFVVCIYLAHLLALGIYGAALGLLLLSRLSERKISIRTFACMAGSITLPPLCVLGLTIFLGNSVGSRGTEWRLDAKLITLVSLCGYRGWASLVDFCVLLALSYSLFRTRLLSILPEGKWIAGGLLALFIAFPFSATGSAYDDARIAIGACLIIPAFINSSSRHLAGMYLAPAILFLLSVMNAAVAGAVWLSYQQDFEAMKNSFDRIRPGSFVLVSSSDHPAPQSDYLVGHTFRYAPALAGPYARAFVPPIFSDPGLYVLRVNPRSHAFEVTNPFLYEPPPFNLLKNFSAAGRTDVPEFIRCWPNRYHYLYVLGPPQSDAMPSYLVLLVKSARFSLYKIGEPHAGAESSASAGLNAKGEICSSYTKFNALAEHR